MIGREKELQFIKDGFSKSGYLRCAIALGPEGMGKSTFLEKAKDVHSLKEGKSISITPDSAHYSDLPSLLSSMARNISCGSEIKGNEISKFARFYGSQLVQIEATYRNEDNLEEFNTRLADTFVTGLEDAIIHCGFDLSDIIPLLIVDDIDELGDDALEWLSDSFNKRIRESSLFKKCRFLFSAKFITEKIEQFFSRFGFDKTSEINLPPFTVEQCVRFAKHSGYEITNGDDYRTKSQGIPLKLLNILKKPTTIKIEENNVMSNIDKNITPAFSEFSEKELNYLLFASYPSVVNRYNLEFFCTAREAAFCYNWLKRQKKLAQVQPGGDLIMNEDFRNQMREFHKQEEPEEAEQMSTTATILDTFTSLFQNPGQHWIPVTLQLFDSFTKDLCRKIFDEIECDEIFSILNERDDLFNISNKQYSLNDDIKLVTKRFIEIGGGGPKENIGEKAKVEWIKYQEESTEKRMRLEQERTNLEEEAFDAEKKIFSLDELKNQLAANHKNPPSQKSKREYSFSTSVILIAIGLGTTGASIFLDSLGSYHAAAGILLTIFGFFWPNVEIKKQVFQSAGKAPKLAIETQQRSLTHRMSGLASRVSSIRSNLENLNSDLEGLDQGMNAPYISE
ncbi:MAG: hypothetical protein QNL93_09285 [Opitutae bacterium]